MHLPDFTLERFFARYEFTVEQMLGASDVEAITLAELLATADAPALRMWETLSLGYTEAGGLPALRAEIAELYPGLDPDDVLTCAGAQEGIFLAMNVLLSPGDHAVVVSPCYQSLHEVARAIGADVTTIALAQDDWSLDVDAVEAAVTDATRVIVINFPHSPTGALLPDASLQRLVGLCEEREIHLFSDEVYRWLELDPADRTPAAASLSARALSLGVMSKAYGLAGLRVGWVATRDRALLARMASFKDYTTICNAAPSEILALMALRNGENLLSRARRIVADNVSMLDAFCERRRGRLDWVRPRGGSVCFPRLTEGNAEELAERLVRDQGVLVVPGIHFGPYPRHFRVGLGRRNLPVALERFESFLARGTV